MYLFIRGTGTGRKLDIPPMYIDYRDQVLRDAQRLLYQYYSEPRPSDMATIFPGSERIGYEDMTERAQVYQVYR